MVLFSFFFSGEICTYFPANIHLNCFFITFSFSDEFLYIYLRGLNVYHSWNTVEEIVCVRRNHKWKYPPFEDKHPIFRNSSEFSREQIAERMWTALGFRPRKSFTFSVWIKFSKICILLSQLEKHRFRLVWRLTLFCSVPNRKSVLNSLGRHR